MTRGRQGRLAVAQKQRMPFISANGLLTPVPCATILNQWAETGTFNRTFYWVQRFRLLASVTNLGLMG